MKSLFKYLRAIATVNVDETGRFSYKLGNLKAGERVSAIAIHPQYRTSEPAELAMIRALNLSTTSAISAFKNQNTIDHVQ